MSHDDSRKKRKANVGRATADGVHDVSTGSTNDGGGFLSSWFGYGASSGPSSQLDRMEQMMVRMEGKLATVSSLESRCEQLEAKCSSLEFMLESVLQSTKEQTEGSESTLKSMREHIDKKLKYHEMLIQNQKWEYSARVLTKNELKSWMNYGDDDADYIYETSRNLKKSTEAMRRGEFPNEDRTVTFHTSDDAYEFDGQNITYELSSHWREFAAALKQFKPAFGVLPDDVSTHIKFGNVILNDEATQLIKEALVNMPFKALWLENDPRIHGGMRTMSRIMGNNKHLQKLDIYQVQMNANDIIELCSAIRRHPSLVDVSITRCGVGNGVLNTLLLTNELKLEKLQMPSNNITSEGISPLLDFLATNPRLKELDLTDNNLDDIDAISLANALRNNTTLRGLYIGENRVGRVGEEAFRDAVRDETSLNAVADSNHICMIESDHESELFNDSKVGETNRARKIYALLDSRHQKMSNVQHFHDIDLKLLPNVLETVQKYSNASNENLNTSIAWQRDHYVAALSIVYEVIRGWDKGSPLYKYSK